MKNALAFYARGKQKEAIADEYDGSRYYSKDRFICPECGEPVHLTGSKSTSRPLGISSYALSKLIPEAFRDNMPTIEEIEAELNE